MMPQAMCSIAAQVSANFSQCMRRRRNRCITGQVTGTERADLDAGTSTRPLVALVLGLLAVRQTGVPFDGAGAVRELVTLIGRG